MFVYLVICVIAHAIICIPLRMIFKMMKRLKLAALISVSLLLTTCTKDVYNADICFQETILPIFVNNCTQSGCHNAQDHKKGYDFSTYDGIMKGVTAKHPLQSEVYKTVDGNNPSMPQSPYPKLSARQVTDIKIWINMGAPNTRNCKTCDSTLFTYSARVKPIMDTWCVGCHSGTNIGGGYDLSTYAGVATSVTDGRLLGSVEHLSGFSPMPKNAGWLNSCDITAIRKWIEAGHPDN